MKEFIVTAKETIEVWKKIRIMALSPQEAVDMACRDDFDGANVSVEKEESLLREIEFVEFEGTSQEYPEPRICIELEDDDEQ